MSTFNGEVKEFPDIRIDYFRLSSEQTRPPLAFFLSHVHSDHLAGLESCRSPFIYCSPATRDIMLRLEKYPHRMNFSKGILETRKQTYRHLKKLLKAVPLETQTIIELSAGRSIRVTLFDANHCVGAVMFLIEDDSNAVLYTGDIRSELWWVNSLSRNPVLLPYVSVTGQPSMKRLDCVYLDTTFATKDDPYKHFPPKAEGIAEMLMKLAKYPQDTIFYFDSWTFGYEDVWVTLASSLDSQIHLDDYRFGLYRALINGVEAKAPEVHKLMGFQFGNRYQEGCLTTRQSRIHSCERGTGCAVFAQDNNNVVRITPIITRHEGTDIAELGAGGGQGDLNQKHELELGDSDVVAQLMALCVSRLQSQPQLLVNVLEMLSARLNNHTQTIGLEGADLVAAYGIASQNGFDDVDAFDDLPLEKLVPALTKAVARSNQKQEQGPAETSMAARSIGSSSGRTDGLPKTITFPYSRHSSYTELCYLIEAFKPKDIHPCTVDSADWAATHSMGFLFGHIYNTPITFIHDQMMFRKLKGSAATSASQSSQTDSSVETARSKETPRPNHRESPAAPKHHPSSPRLETHPPLLTAPLLGSRARSEFSSEGSGYWYGTTTGAVAAGSIGNRLRRQDQSLPSNDVQGSSPPAKRLRVDASVARSIPLPTPRRAGNVGHKDTNLVGLAETTEDESTEILSTGTSRLAMRVEAYKAAIGESASDWDCVGLVSTGGHQVREEEL